MYQCKLAIKIFSRDDIWLSPIRKIEPSENFDYFPVVLSEFNPDEARKGDIVVIDIPLQDSLPNIRRLCKQNAILIFCGSSMQIASLSEDDLESCNDIWMTPLSPQLVSFHFQQIFKQIKLKKDAYLTHTYLHTVMDNIPDLIWFKDIRGSHLKVNNAFCNAVGKTRSDVEGRGHYYIWDIEPDEYACGEYICLESEEMVLQARKTCVFDERVKSKQGMRQFKTYKSPLFDEDGELMGTVGVAHDVTDLGNMTVELEIILRSMPFAILVHDDKGRITDINRKFEEYFELKPINVIGVDFEKWKKSTLKNSKVNETGKIEVCLKNRGVTRIVEISEEPIVDVFDSFIGKLCICRDVTTERTFEERLMLSANTDVLTGLYNRRYFYERIENCHAPQVSLLYVDLDNFKLINDLHGHQVGDDTLKTVGDILRFCCPGDLICRIGGDEFLIAILEECSPQVLEHKAAHILEEMQMVFDDSENLKILSVSVGIAFSKDPGMHIDQLIKQSDLALLSAKRSGKAQYCVYTGKLQNLVDRRGR